MLVEAVRLGQFSPLCPLLDLQHQYGAEEVDKCSCLTNNHSLLIKLVDGHLFLANPKM